MTRSRIVAAVLLAVASAPVLAATDVVLLDSADVRGTILDPQETDVFRFEAAPGAAISFDLAAKPAGAIDFTVSLTDPLGDPVVLAGRPEFSDAGGRVRLTGLVLAAAGEHRLAVSGTGTGEYRLKWTQGAGAKPAHRLDLRAATLGRPRGGEAAVGRRVGAGAPATLDVEDSACDLDGAQLSVPPLALPAGGYVTIASTGPLKATPPAGTWAVGPALDVRPSVALPGDPATLVLPYDRVLVARTADHDADLRVLRVEDSGATTVLTPLWVDSKAQTVAVETDRFSRFVVVGPKGGPDVTGAQYWTISLDARLDPDQGGDSRRRSLYVGRGRTTFEGGGVMGWRGDEVRSEWWYEDDGLARPILDEQTDVSAAQGWDFAPDGRSLRIYEDQVQVGELLPSEDGACAVTRGAGSSSEPQVGLVVALRRPSRRVAPASYVGKWWFGALQADAGPDGGGDTMWLTVGANTGAVTLRDDGTWSVKGSDIDTRYDSETDRKERVIERFSGGGTWTVAGPDAGWAEGALALSQGGEGGILLLPSADGNAVIGAWAGDGNFMFLVGVRRGAALRVSSLRATCLASEMGLNLDMYPIPGPTAGLMAPDFDAYEGEIDLVFRGTRQLGLANQVEHSVGRAYGAPGGVEVETGPGGAPPAVGISVRKDGRFTVAAGPNDRAAGAIAPGGGFGYLLMTPGRSDGSSYGLLVFVEPPAAAGP